MTEEEKRIKEETHKKAELLAEEIAKKYTGNPEGKKAYTAGFYQGANLSMARVKELEEALKKSESGRQEMADLIVTLSGTLSFIAAALKELRAGQDENLFPEALEAFVMNVENAETELVLSKGYDETFNSYIQKLQKSGSQFIRGVLYGDEPTGDSETETE